MLMTVFSCQGSSGLTLTETASLMRAMTCSLSFLLPDCCCRTLPEALWTEQVVSGLR